MDFRSLLADPKILAALIAGIFAIVAAYIRRDKRPEKTSAKYPVLRLLGFPILYLLLGAGLLAAEFFCANVDRTGELSLQKPGALLILGGCVFAVSGVAWLPINVVRLMVWPKPKDLPGASTPVRSALVHSTPAPAASTGGAKPEKPRAKRPALRLLGLPILSLLVAAGLAAAVYFRLVVESKDDAGKVNPVALLQLAACVFGAAGAVWAPVNIVRLLTWPRPPEASRPAGPAATTPSQPTRAARRAMKRGATASFLFTAFVWLLVIGVGTLAAHFYQQWSVTDRESAAAAMQALENEFRAKWQDALDTCADTPPVDAFVNRAPWLYRIKFADKLRQVDETLRKKHPRIRLACDSFSGYCVFRSADFQKSLGDQGIWVHLIDDKADYNKRIQALQSGETPLAVFTVDSLINNSALFDAPPGVLVMVIDESQGADAMVSYQAALPNLEALNRSDLKIVLTPDSPSETLARLVRLKCNLTEVPKECFVPADNAEDVYNRFKSADAGSPTAFVLWEPYVSRLLREQPQAYKLLIDSSDLRCRGYIVDILVAQKDFLEKNRKDVEGLVKAYLETAAAYQKAPRGMAGLVQTDSKQLAAAGKLSLELKPDEADNVVQGIHWATARENYARFGLLAGDTAQDAEPLEDAIKKITDFLVKTKTISRGVKESLVDKQTCADLVTEGFGLGGPVSFGADHPDLSEEAIKQLQTIVSSLKSLPDRSLEILASPQETPPRDPTLAQKRADAVFNWLRDHGVEEKRMTRTVAAADDGKVVFRFVKPPS